VSFNLLIMLKKYKHIAFDLDGTLVHTVSEYRHKVVPEVVARLGGTISSPHAVDRFWFEAGRDKIIRNEFSLEPEKFWKLFRTIDAPEKRAAHTHAYDDAERTLRKLKDSDKIISIITGAPHFIAQMEIAKLNGAPHDFYFSITDNKEFIEKPDPKSFLYVLQKLSLNPSETVYVGNSNEDAQYAKNAGVDFIYLERKEHEFDLKNYAITTINSLDELF
jgi:phosphoglycolate phosphatase